MGRLSTRNRMLVVGAAVCVAAPAPGEAQLANGTMLGPGPQLIRQMTTDEVIDHLSLASERGPNGWEKFTWADEEFIRRLDTNQVTWGQLARAMEQMQIMRTEPVWPAGSNVRVWMRLPYWWRSVELTAAVEPHKATVLSCHTRRDSCGVATMGQERTESDQMLGVYPPGHHEVRFHAAFKSVYWQADARETWEPTFVLRFDVAPVAK